MQILADLDTSFLELLDFEHTPACEGETHSMSLHGHHAEDPAAWVLTMPCCGPKILVCEPRRQHIIAGGDIRCSIHDRLVDTADVTFTPIK